MKNLLIKEFRLARHPTSILFLFLSAMVMIPDYPYFVVFFYSCLGTFFICLGGRENRDVYYTMLLPVPKRDLVKARIAMVALLQLAQVAMCAPFAALRTALIPAPNAVGLEANIALLGLGLAFFGIFNAAFFTRYYRNMNKVGGPFLAGTIASTAFMLLIEGCVHVVPFFRDRLDTPDPQFLPEKLAVLAAGLALYLALTAYAYHRSAKSFEKLDL